MADAKWMRTYAEAMDNVLSAKVQAFELNRIQFENWSFVSKSNRVNEKGDGAN